MPADVTLNSGSGGAIIATDPTTSSEHYQLIKLAQGAVGTFTLVTTANALPVVTGSSFQGGITSLSSQISVTATSATNPWSSAPGFNVPVVTVSSGVSQVFLPTISAAGFGPVTSSAGVVANLSSGTVSLSSQITVTATGPVTITSGTVTLSSVPTVFSASSGGIQAFIPISPTSSVAGAGFGPVTSSAGVLASLSSGTVTLSSVHTVTATAATNPWSSAPGFNVPVVTVSSGLVQISGTPLVNIVGTSSGMAVVTTSGGLVVQATGPFGTVTVLSASSGLVQLTVPTLVSLGTTAAAPIAVLVTSSAGPVFSAGVNTAAGYGPVTSSAGRLSSLSSGTVTLSSAIGISSGTVTLSSVHTVTATAGTNPWSSAPGFNVPVVTVSSGFVRAFPCGAVTSSGLKAYHAMSTGGAVATNVTTAPSSLYGYSIFNSSATIQAVKFYNTTAPTVGGSTANLLLTVMAPGSTGGGGANLTLPMGLYSSNGWSLIISAAMNDTDTGAPGTNTVSVGMFYQT